MKLESHRIRTTIETAIKFMVLTNRVSHEFMVNNSHCKQLAAGCAVDKLDGCMMHRSAKRGSRLVYSRKRS